MPTYGLTAEGFVPKTVEVIRAEINTSLQNAFGSSIDLSDSSLLGQLVGIVSEREAIVWELAEDLSASMDPDAATGTLLEALCALTGTVKNSALPSTVALTLTGTPLTVVPASSRAATSSTDVDFATLEAATIATLAAWAITTAYVVGDRRTNVTRAYECITSGTSAGSGGPTTTSLDITDGTAHWKYLGEGAGAVDADAEATETGELAGVAYDISVIKTPVSGWSSVVNLLDADMGRDVESDGALRVRREAELAVSGTSTADAIRADLLGVVDVTAVTVFVNNTDTIDADGVPPHAVECLVQGGADQDLWDQLLDSVAAGIATYGTESGTALDSEGTSHTMKFSRPDEINIYVIINLIIDSDTYPTDGDAQVKAAIIAWGDAQATGKNAVASAIGAQAFTIDGVLDVTSTLIDDAPAPAVSTTVAISLRELAMYDTSRITVNTTPGTP